MDWKDALIFKVLKQVDFMFSRSLTHILARSNMHVSKRSDQNHLCSIQKAPAPSVKASASLEVLSTGDDEQVFGQIFLLQEPSAILGQIITSDLVYFSRRKS